MAPPDNIVIYSKRVREINGHREQIRPDGRITLPLLGDVFVAGKTCEEVSAELSATAIEYYDDADVTVWVTSYNSQKIFVFGEVAVPGSYAYNGANTVLGTLSRAQPTRLSDPSRVQVLRPNADGDLRKRMTINLDKMVKEGDTTLDAVLEEGDVIYVPPNPLAAVGLALQQLLLPIQPAASTVKGPTEIDQSFSQSPYNSPN
jgi:polysaccharide export outer membrane protein